MPAKTKAPDDTFVTIWKDTTSAHKGLLTYADGKEVALRTEDEVSRATNPAPRVLQSTAEDAAFLDTWLRASTDSATARKHPYLAVPTPLVREVLGWDV